MSENLKVRLKASGIHFLVSAFVLAAVFVAIFTIYYPGLLGIASGVLPIVVVLVVVDLALGPLLTFVVFNKSKPELVRDMAVVILIQLAALFYGLWILFSVRPVFIVFNVNRFDVVYANEVSVESLERAVRKEFSTIPVGGPVYVGARLPQDAELARKIIMTAISGGKDLQQFPEYYVPYNEIAGDIIQDAKPLEGLKKYNSDRLDDVSDLLRRYSSDIDNIGYLNLKAKSGDLTVIVNRRDGSILELSTVSSVDYSYGVDSIDLKKILNKK